MSIDEINCFLKAVNDKRCDEWEKIRYQCFYSVVATNGSKQFKQPSDLFKFSWDTPKKSGKPAKKLSKEQFENKAKEAEKWLDKKK